MKIALILVVFDNFQETETCIKEIKNSIKKKETHLDIVLVNNGSNNQMPLSLRKQCDVLLSIPVNKGFSKGLNCGLSYATNYYNKIFIINNDVIMNSNCIDQMLYYSKNYDYVTVGMKNYNGKIENNGTGFVNTLMGRAGHNTSQSSNIGFLNLACCIIDKKVFEVIGFLRDDLFFLYWEDVEFSRRLLNAKHTFNYKIIEDVYVIHGSGITTKKLGAKLQFYYASSAIIFFLNGNNIFEGIYASMVGSILRFLKSLLKFEFKVSFYIFFGILYGFFKGFYTRYNQK